MRRSRLDWAAGLRGSIVVGMVLACTDGLCDDTGLVAFVSTANRLEMVSPDGTPVRTVRLEGTRLIRQMHAAPGEKAVLLAVDDKMNLAFVEIDAHGKKGWELPLTSVLKDKEMPVSYEPLAGGGILACFRPGFQGQGIAHGQRIVQVDRSGQVVRELKLDAGNPYLRAVHRIDEKRLLVVETDRVYEMDWTGKETFVLPLAKGPAYVDCVRTLEGTYVVAANTRRETGKKSGWIAELKPDGQEVWKTPHECPASLHPSVDFRTVILEAG